MHGDSRVSGNSSMKENNILVINSRDDLGVLKGLASTLRLKILEFIQKQPRNVNEIAEGLGLAQSTVASNIMALEQTGLVKTQNVKGRKGTQKVCSAVYTEMVIRFSNGDLTEKPSDAIVVDMPVGLYTRYTVSAPCGLCSQEGIIGYLDVADSFLDPARMKAGLVWFEAGHLEYKFPNNSLYKDRPLKSLEVSAEMSSETGGEQGKWRSNIAVWVNDVEIGQWVTTGGHSDRKGKRTPGWWKREGSQYGELKHFLVCEDGSYLDGVRISDACLADLRLPEHHSITVRIGANEHEGHGGGVSIFGKEFGDFEQDLVLRLSF